MTGRIIFGLAHLAFDLVLIWMLFGRLGKRGLAKERSNGRVEFAPDRIALWACLPIAAGLAFLALKDLTERHRTALDFLNPAMFGLIALLLFFSFPGTIFVTTEGLEAVYWLRKNMRIRWKDIETIDADTKKSWASTVAITSIDGTRIVHSSLLADRRRFMLEIQRHCGEELPPEFLREPIES